MTDKKASRKKLPPIRERSVDMLKGFGLTENEALVYTYLLERGMEVGGSKIAVGTGIHRQYVYISMVKLIGLGLVEAVTHGKHKKYKAVAQSQVEKIARKRVLEAEELVRELNTFSLVGHEQDFEVYQGRQQLQNFEIEYAKGLAMNEIQYIIGGAADHFYDAMEDRYDEFVEIIKKKNLITHYIGPEEELNAMKKAHAAHPGFIYRTLNGFPKVIQNTAIRENSVGVYSFANPPLVYVIKSKTVADNYKKFFEMLWNMAK